MTSRALLAALAAALAVPASADRVDDFLRGRMAGAKIPGAILLVSRDGKPIRVGTYGLANLETTAPVRRDTAFEIGSVSKQFTAAAVLLLVDEGKLGLDEPIGKYLPDAPEKWRPLTLRQVLSHTAGLKDTMQSPDDAKFRQEDYLKKLGALGFDFEPGTSWSYSNMGFNLASMVVEKVSGERFPQFMAKRVFGPLGLKDTRLTDPEIVVPNRARGYTWTGKEWRNMSASYPQTLMGAGAVLSTADDVARWNQALLTGKLLKPASLAEFFRPVDLKDGSTVPYALGWFINQDQGRPLWEHGGNTLGFSCSNLVLPKERVSIIVLTNGGGHGGSALTRRIAALMYPQYDLGRRKPQPDPNPEATAKLMMALRRFGKGQYGDLTAFAPSMRGTLSSVRGALLRMGLGSMGKSVRTYRHLDSETLPDGRRISRYAVRVGENGTVYAQATWTAEGQAEQFATLYGE
ncbi:MAG: serine hydrolase domain-containing protein [Fimbriimonas sp.]